MTPYETMPDVLLERLNLPALEEETYAHCVGFELGTWRCDSYADHLMTWLTDYALKSDELKTLTHANSYVRLKQAAARIYTSDKYKKRGEVGEISLHAICRQFFDTIPFAPRVFYLTSSNDVVKSFDLAHVRYLGEDAVQLWLGEAKFYADRNSAIKEAITSITTHIEAGFLKNQKLILGPQVSTDIPHSEKIRKLFSEEKSLDELFSSAVFPIFVAANSNALQNHIGTTPEYKEAVGEELAALNKALIESGLPKKISIKLIFVPLKSKDALAQSFDTRLKGLML